MWQIVSKFIKIQSKATFKVDKYQNDKKDRYADFIRLKSIEVPFEGTTNSPH